MKKKDLQTLRTKSITELEKQLVEARKKMLPLYPKMAVGQEKNLKVRKILRRDIAQILGIIHEKQISESKEK